MDQDIAIEAAQNLIEYAYACCGVADDTGEARDTCALLLRTAHNLLANITEGTPIAPISVSVINRMGLTFRRGVVN